eukprot:9077834-Pyramimonas_sp.AAC.1
MIDVYRDFRFVLLFPTNFSFVNRLAFHVATFNVDFGISETLLFPEGGITLMRLWRRHCAGLPLSTPFDALAGRFSH